MLRSINHICCEVDMNVGELVYKAMLNLLERNNVCQVAIYACVVSS